MKYKTKRLIFRLTRTRVRLLYWISVIFLMVFIACPMFFFFYLFDEDQVKQMLFEQFDSNNYHVEVRGKITPKFWHGLSFEVNDLEISTTEDVPLVHIKMANCQLSWLDLVVARYKIRRMALNDVDINEKNILNYGFNNLLNWSRMDNSALNHLRNISVFGVNSVDKGAPYPIRDGLLTIDQSGREAKYKFGFELADQQVFIASDGKINAISNDIIQFSDFNTSIYNTNMRIKFTADTSYDITEKELTLDHLSGDMVFSNYKGKISSDKTIFSVGGISANDIKLNLNFDNAFARQGLNLSMNSLSVPGYNRFRLDQAHIKYLIEIQEKKVVLDTILNQIKISESEIISKGCYNELSYTSPNLINNGFKASLSGVCDYNFNRNNLDMSMTGNLNRAPLKLALNVNNNESKPKIIVSGAMDSLDLSPLGVNKDKLLPFYFDNSQLPFAWLSLFDMDGNLSIKHFALDRIHLNDVSTTFNLKDDILNIIKLHANVYNGTLVGSARIAKTESSYDISTLETIENLDLKQMFEDLFDVEAISGVANLKINASSNNVVSYEDSHKHLNGKITVDANHGAFQGVDFNIFSASSALSVNKSTMFEQLRAQLDFINGVSKNGNITFYSPYVIANGNGTVDFVDTQLDYMLTIKSALPPNEQKISSVIIPVSAKGDLFNPQITIQNIHLFTGQQHILRENKVPARPAKKTKTSSKKG